MSRKARGSCKKPRNRATPELRSPAAAVPRVRGVVRLGVGRARHADCMHARPRGSQRLLSEGARAVLLCMQAGRRGKAARAV